MTAPTPEQMRALADRLARRQATIGLDREAESVLRAAADQLQAVQQMAVRFNRRGGLGYDVHAWLGTLAAGTATQEPER